MQFIFVSLLGADPNSPIPLAQAKAMTEAGLRASGVPYTTIAPDFYMELTLVGFVGGPALRGQAVTIVGNLAALNQHLDLGGRNRFRSWTPSRSTSTYWVTPCPCGLWRRASPLPACRHS